MLRVVSWTDQPSRTSPSSSGPLHILQRTGGLGVHASVLRVSYFGLWDVSHQSFSSRGRHSCSFCSSRCFGYVPRGQWAPLGADMLVLIDRSACLVELCTCGRRLVSLVCNLLISAVTDPHTCLTSLTLSPLRSLFVHVHAFLQKLNLCHWNLLDDFPVLDHGESPRCSSTASHQSSQHAAVDHLLSHLPVSHSARPSWITSASSVAVRSTSSRLSQGLIDWRKTRSLGKHHTSFRMLDHLRSGPQSPCHPCPRGRKCGGVLFGQGAPAPQRKCAWL